MLRIVVLFWFAVLSAPLFGQIVRVTDIDDGKPLPYVNIYNKDKTISTTTNDLGQANIQEFRGEDSIYFQFLGYQNQAISFRQLSNQLYRIRLEEQAITLGTVVVSAKQWEENTREVPNKILKIRSKDIAFANPQTAADLLGSSEEVYIQKSQLGGGSPMIRGFSTNRVLLVVDGVRMNNAIFRSGNLQNVIALDANAVENAEVIFGPGSVIYGSDAIGGVMDFHTLDPTLSLGDSLLINGGTTMRYATANREKTTHFHLNYGQKKWAGISSISFSDFDNLTMGTKGNDAYRRTTFARNIDGVDVEVANPDPDEQIETAYQQLNLMQKLLYRPSEKLELQYAFHYSRSSDVPRYDRLIERRNGTLRNAEWYYGPQIWSMHQLKVALSDSTKFYDRVRFIAAYQHFEESRNDRRFGSNWLRNRTETVDAFSLNLDLEKTLNENTVLFYGLEGVLNQIGSVAKREHIFSNESEAIATRYPDDSDWQSFAAYLSFKRNINPSLTLIGGLRYNQVGLNAMLDTTFFDFPTTEVDMNNGALNASAGIAYHPDDQWQLNLNFSSGFRAPNIDDVAKVFDSEPGSVIVPNDDLSPELAYNLDIGAARRISNVLKLDVSAFYTILDQAIVRRNSSISSADSIDYDGTLSQVQSLQNASEAYVWGVQAGVDLILPASFSLSTTINYQKGEERDETTDEFIPLRHVAPLFGATHLIYKRNGLKVDLGFFYNGAIENDALAPTEQAKSHIYAQDENGLPHSPSWYRFDLKTSYRFNETVTVSGGIENITDERYRPYSSGIVAPGRNFILSLRGNF